MIPTSAIVIRHATACDYDQRVLRKLAALDSRAPLSGPALLAEVDGVARAALDLADGSVAADPFFLTVELVELLRVRAGSVTRPDCRPRVGRRTVPARAA